MITSGVLIAFGLFMFLTVVLQWALIAWVVMGAKAERKEREDRMAGLMEAMAAADHGQNPTYAPYLTVQNPDTGDEVNFTHLGNGRYGPPEEQPRKNLMEQVEGL